MTPPIGYDIPVTRRWSLQRFMLNFVRLGAPEGFADGRKSLTLAWEDTGRNLKLMSSKKLTPDIIEHPGLVQALHTTCPQATMQFVTPYKDTAVWSIAGSHLLVNFPLV